MKIFRAITVFGMGILFSRCAWGDDLGTIAGNISGPIELARHLFSGGCFILGVGFLIASFFRYLRFRQNSQESPIGMVILLFLLGLGLMLLPFSHQLANYLAVNYGIGDVVTSDS